MLNSNTLEELTSIFKKVCIIYNSQYMSDDYNKAYDSIVLFIKSKRESFLLIKILKVKHTELNVMLRMARN